MKIPEQYLPIMPYLILKDTKGFLMFTKEVFSAEVQLIVPSEDGKIMHGEIRIFDAVVMFGGAGEKWKEKSAAMYMYVEDVSKTYQLAIGHKAKVLEKPGKKEYGYTAAFEDPFGNQWFVVEAEK